MVVYENFFTFSQNFLSEAWLNFLLIGNHHKTILLPVRSECSSCWGIFELTIDTLSISWSYMWSRKNGPGETATESFNAINPRLYWPARLADKCWSPRETGSTGCWVLLHSHWRSLPGPGFLEKLAKSYVGVPLPPGVGTLPKGNPGSAPDSTKSNMRKELQSLEGEYYSGILLIQPSVVKLIELAQFDKTTAFWQKSHNLSWN